MARRRPTRHKRHQQPAPRRFTIRQLLLVTLIVLPTITLSSAPPQQSPTRRQPSPPNGLPVRGRIGPRVLIDGALNPERIDRQILTAQIMRTMAIPPSPSKADERRLHIRAKAIGLGRRDEQILRAEMIRLHTALAPIQVRMLAGSSSAADITAHRQTRLDSYGRLLETLSADGRSKLNEYIDRAKRDVKIFAGEDQR